MKTPARHRITISVVRIRCRVYPFPALRFSRVRLFPSRSRSFLGSFSNTSSYDRRRQSRSSECVNASRDSSPIHQLRARYGAGMMLGRSVNSANSSGVDLKEIQTVAGSSETIANILPATLNRRWLPHWICSVACGSEIQNSRTESVVMKRVVGKAVGALLDFTFRIFLTHCHAEALLSR